MSRAAAALAAVLVACGPPPLAPPAPGTRPPTRADLDAYTRDLPGDGALVATIETPYGAITCELFADRAPVTVASFVGLARGLHPWWNPETKRAEQGTPYFDGLSFHRVVPGFMIQGGDPTGTGTGGPGYVFADEIDPSLVHDRAGVLSMANGGANTNGSQFFITDGKAKHLDGKHTVFGRCADLDVIARIARVPAAGERPRGRVVIERVTISRRP